MAMTPSTERERLMQQLGVNMENPSLTKAFARALGDTITSIPAPGAGIASKRWTKDYGKFLKNFNEEEAVEMAVQRRGESSFLKWLKGGEKKYTQKAEELHKEYKRTRNFEKANEAIVEGRKATQFRQAREAMHGEGSGMQFIEGESAAKHMHKYQGLPTHGEIVSRNTKMIHGYIQKEGFVPALQKLSKAYPKMNRKEDFVEDIAEVLKGLPEGDRNWILRSLNHIEGELPKDLLRSLFE